MNELQTAKELKAMYDKHYGRHSMMSINFVKFTIREARDNLEDLGCGKIYMRRLFLPQGIDDFEYKCSKNKLCPNCLAKDVDKAKEIYEEILK